MTVTEARAKPWSRISTTRGLSRRESRTTQWRAGRCDRSKTVIEPLLSDQWFCKMKPLAEPAIKAVEQGETRVYARRCGQRRICTG